MYIKVSILSKLLMEVKEITPGLNITIVYYNKIIDHKEIKS